MSDRTLIEDRIQRVLVALKRVPKRFATIEKPSDFVNNESGLEHMDSICMVLIAAGEEFKKIDRSTDGKLFSRYPQVPWRGAMGLRDVLAHGYFQVDPEQLYNICQDNIPQLIQVLQQILNDLQRDNLS